MDSGERSLTIKIKICSLLGTLMQHHLELNFKAEVQFRNQVAEYLVLWMTGELVIAENASHMQSLQK